MGGDSGRVWCSIELVGTGAVPGALLNGWGQGQCLVLYCIGGDRGRTWCTIECVGTGAVPSIEKGIPFSIVRGGEKAGLKEKRTFFEAREKKNRKKMWLLE